VSVPFSPAGRRRTARNVAAGLALCWRASPGGLLVIAGLVVAGAALPPTLLGLSRRLVDLVVGGHDSPGQLLPVIAALGLLAAAERGLSAVRGHRQDIFSDRVQLEAQLRFLARSSTVDAGHVDQPEWHDRMARAAGDVRWRGSQLTFTGIGLAASLLTLAGMLGLLLSIRPALVALGLLSVLPEFLLMRHVNRRLYRLWSENTPQHRERAYLHDLMTQPRWFKELRAFQLGDHLLERWRSISQTQIGLLGRVYAGGDRTATATAVLGGVALAAAYWVMAAPSGGRHLSAGELTAAIAAVAAIAGEVSLISSSLLELDQHGQFLDDYFAFLEIPPLVPAPPHPRPVPAPSGARIEFQGVSFRYPGAIEPALRDLTLTIEPGQLLALVGANGAGKTTLVKLLLRFYDPSDGRVLIGGADLRELDPVDLRSRIGVLFQDYGAYELRVRDNLRFGRVEVEPDEARMSASLQAAEAAALVDRLAGGLDAIVGRLFEGGHDLSTGEWQRLALVGAGRADRIARRRGRDRRLRRAAQAPSRPVGGRHLSPLLDGPLREQDRGHRGRPPARAGPARRAGGRRRALRAALRAPGRRLPIACAAWRLASPWLGPTDARP
jgi:ABC-type multidrug transport system fused ATPase/permease subunit